MNCYTNLSKWTFAGILASLLFLAGCAGLGSMEKEIEAMGLEASPDPLIVRGGQVELEVTGQFPAKYFGKKVSIEATPVLSWEGGSASFESQGFQGEDAAGNFTVVPFESGKAFSYTSSVPFDPAMEDAAELAVVISGTQGNKSATFDPYVIGGGVITTPLWVQSDDQFIPIEDNFQRVITYTEEVIVNYRVNSSSVRSSELRDADWKSLQNLLQLSIDADSVTITGARIEAYASPEGEITLNEDLASDRANSAAASVTREMKRKKLTADEAFYNLVPKGEDWLGFKSLMQASDVEDKNLILRVLEMYSDKDQREEEIRSIAKTYREIEKEILPALRRSQVVVSYDVEGYTDAELKDYSFSMPDSLNVEELLYAATLFEDLSDKLMIYQSAARVYVSDFRGYNNAGWCLAKMGRMNQAMEMFQQALELERNKAVVNNVAALNRQNGDIDGAMKLLNEAAGAGPEVGYNKGIILIQKGDYASAISNMGRVSTVNLALAKMLNGDASGAKTALENASDDSAVANYVMAVVCARLNDSAGAKKYLSEALAKDPDLREKAEKDLEFRNMRDVINL